MNSAKFIPGSGAFNVKESRVIEEELSDNEPINAPLPRHEENKSSNGDSSIIEDSDWFGIEFSEDLRRDTPRFDNDDLAFTIMN